MSPHFRPIPLLDKLITGAIIIFIIIIFVIIFTTKKDTVPLPVTPSPLSTPQPQQDKTPWKE
jgi:hypothetical protein